MPRVAVKPKHGLVPLNLKVTPDIRDRLVKAAQRSGRNLTGEVSHRVWLSFEYEKMIGGTASDALASTCRFALEGAANEIARQVVAGVMREAFARGVPVKWNARHNRDTEANS